MSFSSGNVFVVNQVQCWHLEQMVSHIILSYQYLLKLMHLFWLIIEVEQNVFQGSTAMSCVIKSFCCCGGSISAWVCSLHNI